MTSGTGDDDAVGSAKSETLATIAELARNAAEVEAALAQRLDGIRESIEKRADAAIRSLRAHAEVRRAAMREERRREELRSRSEVHRAVAAVAPGLAGVDWTSSAWTSPPAASGHPSALRIGTIELFDTPALLPVSAVPGWRVTGDHAREFIAETVVRSALAFPPGELRVTVFDPRLRGVTGFTSLLREQFPRHFRSAIHAEVEFIAELDQLVTALSGVAEKMSVAGAAMFADLPFRDRGPQELVVVLDAPEGLTVEGVTVLQRLIGGCAGRGVLVLVETPGVPTGPVPLIPDSLLELDDRMISVDVSEKRITTSMPEMGRVRRARPLANVARNNALVAWTEAISAQADLSMTLEALLADLPVGWTDRGADGLVSTIGRSSGAGLEVRLSGTNPATPNALVGGATGSGKSNLLLAMVYSLAHRYSPRDLRLYVLDFKEGIEFAQLAPLDADDWLPHVEVLGLESDRSYGVAVLQHLVDEFDRRAGTFKAFGAASLSSYRELSGQDMPRLVLMADEFQVMFDPDDAMAQRAVELLENLARKGRAYGIHLVLASQTLSGIQSLGIKRESIFAQFHNRISLRNTVAESESILGYGNLAAADLSGRGAVIVNSELGHPAANKEGTVVWAEPTYLARLRCELLQQYRAAGGEPRRPETFTSSDFAPWSSDTAGAIAAVGVPIEVAPSAAGFGLEVGGSGVIGLIGSRDELADAAIRSLVVSTMLHPRAQGAKISLVETSERPVGGEGFIGHLAGMCDESAPNVLERVGADRAGEYLLSLVTDRAAPSSRIDRVVVVDDLALMNGFGENGPWDLDGFCTDFRPFLSRAASSGVLLLVRFRSVSAFTSLGMFGFASDISRLVLMTGQNDASRIDPGIRVDDAWPRVTIVDSERGTWSNLVPFDPSTLPGGEV